MRPFLFELGSYKVPSFFFLILVATLACTFYAFWVARRKGLKAEAILDLGIIGMIGGVVGSRIFHILVEYPAYYWEKPMRVFEFWRGGFVSWGGFLALAVLVPLYLYWKKLPILTYLDTLCTGFPIIKFFVRVACLLTGCCYGRPTELPWAIRFTDPNSTAYYYYPNAWLHPVQVYSMIHAVALFLIVNWVYRRSRFPGQTLAVLIMGWTLPRAIIEFWRGDADRGIWFGGTLSTGQIMGGLAFLAGLALYLLLAKRHAAPD